MAKRNLETRLKFKNEFYTTTDEAGPDSADFGGIVLSRDDWRDARIFRTEVPRERFKVRKLGQYLRDGWATRPGNLDRRGKTLPKRKPFEVRKLGQYLRAGWATRPGKVDRWGKPLPKRKPFDVRKVGQYLRAGWATRPGKVDRWGKPLPKRKPFEVRKLGQYLRAGWATRPGKVDRWGKPLPKRKPFEFRKLGQYFRDGWSGRSSVLPKNYAYRVEILDRHTGRYNREITIKRDWRDFVTFCTSCGGEMDRGRKELCHECALDLYSVGDIEAEEIDD